MVFINSRSGGRAGPKLTEILYQSLGHAQARFATQPPVSDISDPGDVAVSLLSMQVFDLSEHRPGPVLKKIWENFEEQEKAGDQIAPILRR